MRSRHVGRPENHSQLEPEIEDFVRSEVEHGSFGSPGDYVEDLIRERCERDLARHQLDAELQKGIETGRVMSIDEAFDSIYEELGWRRPTR